MNVYRISFGVSAAFSIEIAAENEQEARAKALKAAELAHESVEVALPAENLGLVHDDTFLDENSSWFVEDITDEPDDGIPPFSD